MIENCFGPEIEEDKDSSEVEAVVVADMDDSPPKVEIVESTPAWGNANESMKIERVDHCDMLQGGLANSSMELTAFNVLKGSMHSSRSQAIPQTESGFPMPQATENARDESQLLQGLDRVSKKSSFFELSQNNCDDEEFKAKVNFQPPRPAMGGGAGDDEQLFADECMIEEYDAPDLDSDIGATNLTASQRHILANKTPLETNSNFLNNGQFRDAYLKEKVTAK